MDYEAKFFLKSGYPFVNNQTGASRKYAILKSKKKAEHIVKTIVQVLLFH